MVTIYDIAKTTGYSAPTVSKALNGQGSISQKTRKKIIQIAKEMGYEPNLAARTLSTRKSNLIGIIYDDTGMRKGFAHPMFSVILDKLREYLEEYGYDIIFLSRRSSMSYYSHCDYRSVDGVIIVNPDSADDANFIDFANHKLPCVSTCTIFRGICTVLTENFQSGYKATEYLIKNGHKRIAFISGFQSEVSPSALERWKGYLQAHKDYNLPVADALFEGSVFWDSDSGYECFKKLYERTTDFTAVFAAADSLAFGVMKYAKEHKLSIPEDFSLIGFDDDPACEFSNPPLTTFRHDGEKIARETVDLLMEQINGEILEGIYRIPSTFIERNSVKKLN